MLSRYRVYQLKLFPSCVGFGWAQRRKRCVYINCAAGGSSLLGCTPEIDGDCELKVATPLRLLAEGITPIVGWFCTCTRFPPAVFSAGWVFRMDCDPS